MRLNRHWDYEVEGIDYYQSIALDFSLKFHFEYRDEVICHCIHVKTGNLYQILGVVLNCTNSNSNQVMIHYTEGQLEFVRELSEFIVKFKPMRIDIKSLTSTLRMGCDAILRKSDVTEDMKVIDQYYRSLPSDRIQQLPSELRTYLGSSSDLIELSRIYLKMALSLPNLTANDQSDGFVKYSIKL